MTSTTLIIHNLNWPIKSVTCFCLTKGGVMSPKCWSAFAMSMVKDKPPLKSPSYADGIFYGWFYGFLSCQNPCNNNACYIWIPGISIFKRNLSFARRFYRGSQKHFSGWCVADSYGTNQKLFKEQGPIKGQGSIKDKGPIKDHESIKDQRPIKHQGLIKDQRPIKDQPRTKCTKWSQHSYLRPDCQCAASDRLGFLCNNTSVT